MHKLELIDTTKVIKKPGLNRDPKSHVQKKPEVTELEVFSEDAL
jgi:hypothetical protein